MAFWGESGTNYAGRYCKAVSPGEAYIDANLFVEVKEVPQVQIMYWQEFPSQVKVSEGRKTVRRMLPDYFQQAIDGAAMAAGETDSDAYLDGWQWGPAEEREGDLDEIADAVAAELEEAFPKSRLTEMVRARRKK